MEWTPEKLVKETKSISSLPSTFTRLNDAVNSSRSSTLDIAKIIGEDAGLTARLLRIANSSFYAFPTKIDTITKAVTIIGTNQLRDLTLGTSVIALFEGMPIDINMETFWRHSIACGVTARILATYRRETNVERFFVAGLLHDIGRLILFLKLPNETSEVLRKAKSENELLHKIEKDMFGFDHADVGGALLKLWKIPEHTATAVGFHHRPTKLRNFHVDATVIHVSDIIVHAMQMGNSGEDFAPSLDNNAWEQLGLPESVLSSTLTQLQQQYDEAVELVLGSNDP